METRSTKSPSLPALSKKVQQATRARQAGYRRRLFAILALFVALGVLYVWHTPPFEGPDEGQHFAYIHWLVEHGGFPPQGAAAWETPVQQEGGQPPLYYVLASLPARLVGLDDPEAVYRPNPYAFTGPPPATLSDNDNRAIHYPDDVQRLAGGWLALYLARALSLAAGVLTLVSVHGLARQTVPSMPDLALTTTLLVAVSPQFIFINSVASNDPMAVALSTLTLWLLATTLRQGPNRRRAIMMGVAYGAAAITKASALALGLPIAAGLVWLWLSRRHSLRELAPAGLWLALSTAVVAGWWFIRSWWRYGSPLGLEAHDLTPWAVNDPSRLARPVARWQEVFRTYWFALGWGTIRAETWVYQILAVFTALALVGLAYAAWRQRRKITHTNTTFFVFLLWGLALLTMSVFLEIWMRRVIAPYGRLLFPAIGPITVLLVMGWRTIHPRFPLLPIGFVAGLALLAPSVMLQPAYEPPEMMVAEEAAALETPYHLRFAVEGGPPAIELLSAKSLERSVLSYEGNSIPVRVCWKAIGRPARDYTVLVHIIGPDNAVITSRRTYPGLGRYPTSIWRTGDAFCDVVRVPTWDELAETLVYKVEVALLDEATEKRLQMIDEGGNEWPILFVGNVRLVSLEERETVSSLPGDEALQLLAYQVAERWQAGEDHSFSLRWGVARPVGKDYQVFVHLREPETGEIVAQADGPPVEGWYPTSWWTQGEVIVDERTFELPADIPDGRYQLVTGFYELESGLRFGNEHFLGMVEVTS